MTAYHHDPVMVGSGLVRGNHGTEDCAHGRGTAITAADLAGEYTAENTTGNHRRCGPLVIAAYHHHLVVMTVMVTPVMTMALIPMPMGIRTVAVVTIPAVFRRASMMAMGIPLVPAVVLFGFTMVVESVIAVFCGTGGRAYGGERNRTGHYSQAK